MRGIAFAVAMTFAGHLGAQELWIASSKFWYSLGEVADLQVMLTENRNAQGYTLLPQSVDRFETQLEGNVDNLKDGVKGNEQGHFKTSLVAEGTAAVVLKTKGEPMEMDLPVFQGYLKEYDLDAPDATESPVKEVFRRYTRLLLQVGSTMSEMPAAPGDFSLEVVPVKNPYTLKAGEQMKFKILWQGKPLFGARVKVWNMHNHRTMLQNIYTEKDGTIQTPISNEGTWMVSALYRLAPRDGKAEGTTFCSSLVFGIEESK